MEIAWLLRGKSHFKWFQNSGSDHTYGWPSKASAEGEAEKS